MPPSALLSADNCSLFARELLLLLGCIPGVQATHERVRELPAHAHAARSSLSPRHATGPTPALLHGWRGLELGTLHSRLPALLQPTRVAPLLSAWTPAVEAAARAPGRRQLPRTSQLDRPPAMPARARSSSVALLPLACCYHAGVPQALELRRLGAPGALHPAGAFCWRGAPAAPRPELLPVHLRSRAPSASAPLARAAPQGRAVPPPLRTAAAPRAAAARAGCRRRAAGPAPRPPL